jgi:hypothetical protein
MSNLVHGKTVSLKVKNIMWPHRDRYANGVITNEFNFYEGEVRYEKWFKPNQVGLTTGDPRFPMRVIELERIVEIDGVERSKSSEQSLQISNGGEGLRRTVKGVGDHPALVQAINFVEIADTSKKSAKRNQSRRRT